MLHRHQHPQPRQHRPRPDNRPDARPRRALHRLLARRLDPNNKHADRVSQRPPRQPLRQPSGAVARKGYNIPAIGACEDRRSGDANVLATGREKEVALMLHKHRRDESLLDVAEFRKPPAFAPLTDKSRRKAEATETRYTPDIEATDRGPLRTQLARQHRRLPCHRCRRSAHPTRRLRIVIHTAIGIVVAAIDVITTAGHRSTGLYCARQPRHLSNAT